MSYTLRILKASFLRKKLKDINISYIRVGDYFIPDLTLPEETRPIGKWGTDTSGLSERVQADHIAVIVTAVIDFATLCVGITANLFQVFVFFRFNQPEKMICKCPQLFT